VPTAATVNLGGGGAGAVASATTAGGAGGKGVVIIRQAQEAKYPTTLTGGVASATSTHLVFTFNDSGTIGWS
jgi:hypothetical protein